MGREKRGWKGLAAKDRLIFALDEGDLAQAREWVRRLRDHVGFFKVGQELFTSSGPRAVDMVREEGGRVFLDLKFHDIPTTVARAVLAGAGLGAEIMTVHALGGYQMMREAAEVLAHKGGPCLVAVTILTSLSEGALKELAVSLRLEEMVIHLAHLARKAGLDGIVASPWEVGHIRKSMGDDFLIVTPGIRPALFDLQDQARAASPAAAIRAGADLIVVGRPIRTAADPLAVVAEIVTAIEEGSLGPFEEPVEWHKDQ